MLARSTAWRHGVGRTVANAVDEQHVVVPDQDVGGLDVAVGDPRVPPPPHHAQSVVDDLVAYLGVAYFLSAIEELHHDQVLSFRRDLDEAVGAGRGQPGIAHQAQHVIFVLGQPAARWRTVSRLRAARR